MTQPTLFPLACLLVPGAHTSHATTTTPACKAHMYGYLHLVHWESRLQKPTPCHTEKRRGHGTNVVYMIAGDSRERRETATSKETELSQRDDYHVCRPATATPLKDVCTSTGFRRCLHL